MKYKKIIAVILSLIYPIFINQGIVLAEDMKTAISEITEKDKTENISEVIEEKTTENDNIETTSSKEESIATTSENTTDKSVEENSLDKIQKETPSEEIKQEKSSENSNEEVNTLEQKIDNNTNNTETTENTQNTNEITNQVEETSESENNKQTSENKTEEVIEETEGTNTEATEENKTNLENEEQNTTLSEEKINSQEISSDNQEEIRENSGTKSSIEEPKINTDEAEKSKNTTTDEISPSEENQSSKGDNLDNTNNKSTLNEESKVEKITKEDIVKDSSSISEVEKSTLSEPTPVVKTMAVESPSESQNNLEIATTSILTPTIHSKASGDYWNNANTWVEGRIPTENDIVEINGDVKINGNYTVSGLEITTGSVLQSRGDVSLTVNGDIINNGTVKNYSSSYDLTVKVDGNIQNNGEWNPYRTYLNWDAIPEATSYQINITGQDLATSNTNSYRVSNSIIQDTNNKFYWYVRGVKSDGTYTDYTNTQCINDESCLGGGNTNIPTIPTNLKQTYRNASMTEEDPDKTIEPGQAIGKAQSGGEIILSVDVQDNVKLNFEVYKDYQAGQSNTPVFSGNTTLGIKEIKYTYQEPGKYNWRVRSESVDGKFSEWQDFEGETDFSLFEGFEPYPYGYKFPNRSVADGVLTGRGEGPKTYVAGFFSPYYLPISEVKESGTRWDIFEKVFDTSVFKNEIEKIRAFENLGMNDDKLFKGGNCYGMATSASMMSASKEIMSSIFQNFSEKVGDGTIWDKITELKTIKLENGRIRWSEYNETLDTILSFQLSQQNTDILKTKYKHRKYIKDFKVEDQNFENNSNSIPNMIKENPKITYILGFSWKGDEDIIGDESGHAVVPYRVESINKGNRIYFWDNNNPYIKNDDGNYKSYEQYVDIKNDGTGDVIFSKEFYNNQVGLDYFYLADIKELYPDGIKGILNGFGESDQSIKLDGNSDITLVDSQGRISGFQNGQILEEIPGVEVITIVKDVLNQDSEVLWKEIYLPEMQAELMVRVSGNIDESYDLTVVGGDVYTKIESVETTDGQVDTFNITKNNIKMDFDDSKTGEYNILVDNFYNNGTGEIYENNMESEIKPQQYNIDWISIYNNFNGVTYGIDKNLDGIYEDYTNLLPTFSPSVLMTSPSLHMESISPEKSLENKKGK